MDETFNIECLKAHNELRALHKSPALKLSARLAEDAQVRADVIARKSKMRQRSQENFGESISYSNEMETGEEISLKWYSEIDDYKFGQDRQTLASISRFSQLIWKDSTEVGFGRSRFPEGQWVVVGHYVKPGNNVGKFIQNVHQRIIGWEKYPIIIKLKILLGQKNSVRRSPIENNIHSGLESYLPVKKNNENGVPNKTMIISKSENGRDQYDNTDSSQPENNLKTFTLKQKQHIDNYYTNENEERLKMNSHKSSSIDSSQQQVSLAYSDRNIVSLKEHRKNDTYQENRQKEYNRYSNNFPQNNGNNSISDEEDMRTTETEKFSNYHENKDNHPAVLFKENNDIGTNDQDYFQSNSETDPEEEYIQSNNIQMDFSAFDPQIESQHNDESDFYDDGLKEFRQSILSEHNKYRRIHRVKLLKSNNGLERMAQNWADQIASTNQIGNCNELFKGMDIGENIVIQLKGNSYSNTYKVVENWYKEIVDFEYEIEPDNFENIGHFTQVVWKATEQIGVGISTLKNYAVIVCFYLPAGNIEGKFLKNVLRASEEIHVD